MTTNLKIGKQTYKDCLVYELNYDLFVNDDSFNDIRKKFKDEVGKKCTVVIDHRGWGFTTGSIEDDPNQYDEIKTDEKYCVLLRNDADSDIPKAVCVEFKQPERVKDIYDIREELEATKFLESGKKFKIRQHIPSCVSGYDPEVSYFDSVEEMLEIEWVKRWSQGESFHRYSCSVNYSIIDDKINTIYLMAEIDSGKRWWVIGYISSLDGYDGIIDKLPKWEHK